MNRRRWLGLAGLAAAIGGAWSMPATANSPFGPGFAPLPVDTVTRPLSWGDLPGWDGDDHLAAFRTFLRTCPADQPALRVAQPRPPALDFVCNQARQHAGTMTTSLSARAFFEQNFTPLEIRPNNGNGFLTGYYEPELLASRQPSPDFPEPVLGRPADLVTVPQGEAAPVPLDPGLQAWRNGPNGPEPYPDRAAIWAGTLQDRAPRLAWLRDKPDLFITQVQGSARIRWAEGGTSRLVYAGRNGHAYTSIGRKLVERGIMRLESMTLASLMGWLRANPTEARALMEENRSFVFFALDDSLAPEDGPIGGAGVSLTPGRSLAVDRNLWPYGMPVFIDVEPLQPEGGRRRIQRLMVAQDTGSAIVGPARGDFFVGSGDVAGERAGLFRDPMRFIILLPKTS